MVQNTVEHAGTCAVLLEKFPENHMALELC